MLLYYIRHGDPVYEPDSLTPLGQEQAKAVARRLAMHGIDKVFTSTSNRAIQTAQPLCDLLKIEPVPMHWCNEGVFFGEMSVPLEDNRLKWAVSTPEWRRILNSNEIRQMGDYWYNHPSLAVTRMKEGITRINRETDNWLETLGYRRDEENHCYTELKPNSDRVALFAHWGVSGGIMSHILGIPFPQYALHFYLSHSGVIVLEFAEKDGMVIPRVLSFSNDSHLYKDGLPTRVENKIYI